MDRQGVTIASDRYRLVTRGAEPAQLEAIIAELQSVTRGTYGQYCGLSRALEMVGERWGLLIVRDLLVGPRSVADLHGGLPKIPVEVLSTRLTEYGHALEDVVLALGRWGAATLDEPRPEDIVTADSLTLALRATFQADTARLAHTDFTFELRVGAVVLHVRIDDGVLEVARSPIAGASAGGVLDVGGALKGLLTGEISVAEALSSGRATGDPGLLATFTELFQLPRTAAASVG
jgi:DNA-binding HxlR family transcriptional regulator